MTADDTGLMEVTPDSLKTCGQETQADAIKRSSHPSSRPTRSTNRSTNQGILELVVTTQRHSRQTALRRRFARNSSFYGRMVAQPVEHHEDPLDLQRILRELPGRERANFLAAYREALDGARDPAGWGNLRQGFDMLVSLLARCRKPVCFPHPSRMPYPQWSYFPRNVRRSVPP